MKRELGLASVLHFLRAIAIAAQLTWSGVASVAGQIPGSDTDEAPWFLVDTLAAAPQALSTQAQDSLATFLRARMNGWARADTSFHPTRYSVRKVRPNGTVHRVWLGSTYLLTELAPGLWAARLEDGEEMMALFLALGVSDP